MADTPKKYPENAQHLDMPKTAKQESPPSLSKKPSRENYGEQGRQGNIRQNTRHQGYQQDR